MPFSVFLSLSRSPLFPSFSFPLARSLSLSLAFSLSLSIYRQLLAQELHTDKDKLRPYVGYVTSFDHHLTRPPLLDYKGTSPTLDPTVGPCLGFLRGPKGEWGFL